MKLDLPSLRSQFVKNFSKSTLKAQFCLLHDDWNPILIYTCNVISVLWFFTPLDERIQEYSFNPVDTTDLFLYPLKTENQRFSNVFRGYKVQWHVMGSLFLLGLQTSELNFSRVLERKHLSEIAYNLLTLNNYFPVDVISHHSSCSASCTTRRIQNLASKMELFPKIFNDRKPLTAFAKSTILKNI